MTRKTDQQIETFNGKFLRKHPLYKGLTVNCQWYVRDLLTFLMEEGERKRDLPLSESLVIAHRITAALLLTVAFIFYVWVNS